jgi:hypothetical protein
MVILRFSNTLTVLSHSMDPVVITDSLAEYETYTKNFWVFGLCLLPIVRTVLNLHLRTVAYKL